MPALNAGLRNTLENRIIAARDAAEKAVREALERLDVNKPEARANLSESERKLRNQLRAEARRLDPQKGDDGGKGDSQAKTERGFGHLIAECAYEQWHRMLFARFLAENDLLMHPNGVAVTLEDCRELAPEEGFSDAWAAAASYASHMLPGIFRADDPTLEIKLAPEGRQALERILTEIPQATFSSDDGLGWVYQFWQTKAKKEVNASGRKIGGADISPVTQLFTEHYMVEFLLHNTLGAWWASHHPTSPINASLTYLRRLEDGAPAAGTFPGWPERVEHLRVLDPCCGSGHFLTASAELLARMRAEEESIPMPEAFERVLEENLFGLELDPRCTQLAAFALAFTTWRHGGHRAIPTPNVACSGIPVGGRLEDWTKLAGDDPRLKVSLERLWTLFSNAPDLGSLIDPNRVAGEGEMFSADFSEVEGLLATALERDKSGDDPAAAIFGDAARGVARAGALLKRQYHLVITNVPYLARGKQAETVKDHLERQHPNAKSDLATAFVERCRNFCVAGGSYALVTPQNWLFLGSYKKLREELLKSQSWNTVARLGAGAFETIGGEVVNVALLTLTNARPDSSFVMTGMDVSTFKTPLEKAQGLETGEVKVLEQAGQLKNPDFSVTLDIIHSDFMLSDYAIALAGVLSGDSSQFEMLFWEFLHMGHVWNFQQSSLKKTQSYGGRQGVLRWENAKGRLHQLAHDLRERLHDAHERGNEAWGKSGVAVSQMSSLPVSIYTGEFFDCNAAVVLPKNSNHLLAIWSFCSSDEYNQAIRRLTQKLNVTNATLVKVPFDLERWQKVADDLYPNGLPEPYSNDPTQWLFKGSLTDTTEPLQVAVARLLGYRWPDQTADGLPEDEDGIVCLPAVIGELPAAERLRALLAQAYGTVFTPTLQQALLSSVGFDGKDLHEWLRDGFFAQHCKLFHNRPFIWHLWDGRKDGFQALVNYHKLDRSRLEKLIYTYLGAWINTQNAAAQAGEPGAGERVAAAQSLKKKLEAILHGEEPFDLFVRWKKLEDQAVGWEPDLNDGVRLNIRPFVKSEILRSRFTVNWNKDRGTDPKPNAGGTTERLNDLHLSREKKLEARRKAGVSGG